MKTIKRAGIKSQEFKPKYKENLMMNLIKANGGNGYYRKGNFSNELVWDGISYIFPSKTKDNSYVKGMFIFGMVRKDVNNFIKAGGKVKVPKKYPVNEYNDFFDKFGEAITGTDINHAYWRIAYNLGIISELTYQKGLADDFKTIRLAALSTLGKGKEYFLVKDGKITDQVVKIGHDEVRDNIYKAIRYTCFKYMQEVKKLLNNDFVCYRTDCVYYVDTPENRKIVRDYFKKQQMDFKQLAKSKKTLHE